MRPVLFLDIDGVLSTVRTHFQLGRFDPECVRNLNELTAATRAELIISSTWRFHYELQALRQLFLKQRVVARIIGVTPSYIHEGATREQEIRVAYSWLPEAVPYLVIDDDNEAGFGDLLIHCDGAIGLQAADVEQAIKRLGQHSGAAKRFERMAENARALGIVADTLPDARRDTEKGERKVS